jgi:hypothetical protein
MAIWRGNLALSICCSKAGMTHLLQFVAANVWKAMVLQIKIWCPD